MSAPWSIELNQNIFLVVEDNLIVVLGNNDSDWSILCFRNRLRLDAWIDLAGDEVIDKLANIFSGKLLSLVEGELLVLDSLLNSECRPLANFKIKIATVLSECLGVDGSKIDLPFVLLSDSLEVFGEAFTLFWGFGEDVGKWKTSLLDVSVCHKE